MVLRMAFIDKAVSRPGAWKESVPSTSAAAHIRRDHLPVAAAATGAGRDAGADAGAATAAGAALAVSARIVSAVSSSVGVVTLGYDNSPAASASASSG